MRTGAIKMINSSPKVRSISPRKGENGCLRIAAFSDCRVHDIGQVVRMIKAQKEKPDLIFYGGDDISRFRPATGQNYFSILARQSRIGLCAVTGNGEPENEKCIAGVKVFNAHKTYLAIGNYFIMGLKFLPNEEQIVDCLKRGMELANNRQIIILSHVPPFGILDQAARLSESGKHNIGSISLKETIEANPNIKLVVCGHAHLSGRSFYDEGNTTIVNVASHDSVYTPLNLAEIKLEPETVVVNWLKEPAKRANLTEVNGIGPKGAEQLRKKGIRTIKQLAASDPSQIRQILGRRMRPETIIHRAQAFIQNRPIQMEPYEPIEGQRIFFDIETDLAPISYVWMIGCYSECDREFNQFYTNHPQNERSVLRDFSDYLQKFPNARLITYSGTNFDKRSVVQRFEHYGIQVPESLRGTVDILHSIKRAWALPQKSFGLKEVAKYFGYNYKHPDIDGRIVALRYDANAKKHGTTAKIPESFLEYNKDDVMSIQFMLTEIEKMSPIKSTPGVCA